MKANLIKAAQPCFALAEPFGHINVTVVYNPFDTTTRENHQLAYNASWRLSDYMGNLASDEHVEYVVSVNGRNVTDEDWSDIHIAPDDFVIVAPIPRGGGGGKKSILKLVAMVVIAVVAFYAAPVIAGAMPGFSSSMAAMGLNATTIISGAIKAVGGMLVNALMAPSAPKAPDVPAITNANVADTPTYGVDGPRNVSQEGIAVPIVMGKIRFGGNIVNLHTQNSDDTQIVYMRTLLGEGEIDSVSDIQINNEDIANFQNIETDVRHGTSDQELMPWFNDTIRTVAKGTVLGDEFQYLTTNQQVDKLRAEILFRNGLVSVDSQTGAKQNRTVEAEIHYRKKGTSTWLSLSETRTSTIIQSEALSPAQTDKIAVKVDVNSVKSVGGDYYYRVEYKSESASEWSTLFEGNGATGVGTQTVKDTVCTNFQGDQFCTTRDRVVSVATFTLPESGQHEINVPEDVYMVRIVSDGNKATLSEIKVESPAPMKFTDNRRVPIRKSIETPILERGIYEIRAKRVTPESNSDYITDGMIWDGVSQVTTADLTHPFSAMLGIKITLDETLSSMPTVTALIKGIKCGIYDRTGTLLDRKWTNNPAWLAVEALTNTRWGGGAEAWRIDFNAFVDWAEYCEEQGFEFNAVYEREAAAHDQMNMIYRAGRAGGMRMGLKHSVVVMRPTLPSQMFCKSNIIKESLALSWVPMDERANEFEVVYYDEEDNYKRKFVRIVDQEALDRGEPQRQTQINAVGVTKLALAEREGNLQMSINKNLRLAAKWESPIEAIGSRVGDVVYLELDKPQYGVSGRLKVGSDLTNLNLDAPVMFDANKDYSALIRLDALQIASGSVTGAYNQYLTVVGAATNLDALSRVKSGGKDYGVLHWKIDGSDIELVLDRDFEGNDGDAITLWQTDKPIERMVVIPEDTTIGYSSITLTEALPAAPAAYVPYAFGDVKAVKSKFMISSISGDQDHIRTIGAMEYVDEIYNDEAVTANARYEVSSETIEHVTNVQMIEDFVKTPTGLVSEITVSWLPPNDDFYEGADVVIGKNGGIFQTMASIRGGARTAVVTGMEDGDELIIKVIAVNALARRANGETAPTINYTVQGKLLPPASVKDFKVDRVTGGVRMSWSLNDEPDIAGYEIREGITWDTAELLSKGITNNSYFTSKQKSGDYTWLIRAYDQSGIYSEQTTAYTMTLPAPVAVRGFSARQNGVEIGLRWIRNIEPDIAGYEIREGQSWSAGITVYQGQATFTTVPTKGDETRKFWIKAYDQAAMYSDVAAQSSVVVIEPSNRNIFYSNDQHAGGMTGNRFNIVDTANEGTTMVEGSAYAEYSFGLNFPTEGTGRLLIQDDFSTRIDYNETWADMGFSWADSRVDRQWIQEGDLENLDIERFIAPAANDTTFAARMNGDLNDVDGNAPASSGGETYAPGRFDDGLVLSPGANATWNAALGATWRLRWWLRVSGDMETSRILTLNTAGEPIRVDYEADIDCLVWKDRDKVLRVDIPPGAATDRMLMVCMVQHGAGRQFWIGDAETGVYRWLDDDQVPAVSVSQIAVNG